LGIRLDLHAESFAGADLRESSRNRCEDVVRHVRIGFSHRQVAEDDDWEVLSFDCLPSLLSDWADLPIAETVHPLDGLLVFEFFENNQVEVRVAIFVVEVFVGDNIDPARLGEFLDEGRFPTASWSLKVTVSPAVMETNVSSKAFEFMGRRT